MTRTLDKYAFEGLVKSLNTCMSSLLCVVFELKKTTCILFVHLYCFICTCKWLNVPKNYVFCTTVTAFKKLIRYYNIMARQYDIQGVKTSFNLLTGLNTIKT